MSLGSDFDASFKLASQIPADLDRVYSQIIGNALAGSGNDRQIDKLQQALTTIDRLIEKYEAYENSKGDDENDQ
eukprot:270092-Rhodomonas_salina.3